MANKDSTKNWPSVVSAIAAVAAVILGVVVYLWPPPPPPPPSVKNQLDKTLGKRNWFCYPNNFTAIGVHKLPKYFKVENPIKSVDNDKDTWGADK